MEQAENIRKFFQNPWLRNMGRTARHSARHLACRAPQALVLFVLVFCLSGSALANRPNKDTAKNRQDRTISVGKGRISIEESSGTKGNRGSHIEVRPTERSENSTQPSFNGTIEVKPIVVWPKKK